MRTLAIGDIHGTDAALAALLDRVKPEREDCVVVLGDMIDRGPGSRQVIDRLIALQHETRLVAVRGNHEDLLLDVRTHPQDLTFWLCVGGTDTLDSYRCEGPSPADWHIPEAHWAFLEGLVDYHETETHLFTHATPRHDVPIGEQGPIELRWASWDDPRPHRSGKTLVCGHTAMKDGLPATVGHAVCIDTFAYGGQWLTCLECETGILVQANQAGQVRESHIEQFQSPRRRFWFLWRSIASKTLGSLTPSRSRGPRVD